MAIQPWPFSRWLEALIAPQLDPAVAAALAARTAQLPTLWLLGKTGAGKTSIVQRLTGDTRAEIGNGFAPCTAHAMLYEHPQEQPVVRFLDTRGLGEVHYDPQADLAACHASSHALLLVVRVDDADHSAMEQALRSMQRELKSMPVLLVHTALHALSDVAARERAIRYATQTLEAALQRPLPQVSIDLPPPAADGHSNDIGLAQLRQAIIDLVPALRVVLQSEPGNDAEAVLFQRQRAQVLGYCGAAAAADLLPGVGLIAVPTLQGKLLHTLAGRYGLPWNARTARDFLAILGTSFLYRYALGFAGRQLGKLIPIYGQSIGAAAAASVSFASTYALGRAACLYLYRRQRNLSVHSADLRDAFRRAFSERRTQTP